MNYPAIVFDFDGTLADTFDEGLKIYNTIATEFGLRQIHEHEIHKLRTMSVGEFIDYMGIPKRLVPTLLYRGTRMLKSKIPSLPLIKGMAETLPTLRQNASHFGILTSNSVENAKLFLETHGLDGIFTFVQSTSKLTGKARYLRGILKQYTLAPSDLVYVGDEIRDVRAARKAGVASAAVTWGFNCAKSLKETKPDHFFHSPDELAGVFC